AGAPVPVFTPDLAGGPRFAVFLRLPSRSTALSCCPPRQGINLTPAKGSGGGGGSPLRELAPLALPDTDRGARVTRWVGGMAQPLACLPWGGTATAES